MDEVTEATAATEETMEAAEEVTAATADPASLGQVRGASSHFDSLFLVQACAAKECDDMLMETNMSQG